MRWLRSACRRPSDASAPLSRNLVSASIVLVERTPGRTGASRNCSVWATNSISIRPPGANFRSQRFLPGNCAASFSRISRASAISFAGSACAVKRRADHRLNFAAQIRRAGDRARARERQPLPGPGLGFVIAAEGFQTDRDRSLVAGRPQPHVDFIETACRREHRQRRDQPLRQPRIVDDHRHRLRAVGMAYDARARRRRR